MRKRLVITTALIAVLLLLASAYALGYQVYESHNTMSGSTTRSVSPELSTLHFTSASGELLAEFNFSTVRLFDANSTATAAAWGFQIWHAPGFSVQALNITFSIGPSPARVWVSQLSYDTGSNPPLDMRNLNYTGGPSEASGAVLTLSGFPSSENPSTLYSVGLSYGSAATPESVGSTSVLVQMTLASGSGVQYAGETYSGSSGFNLVAGQ